MSNISHSDWHRFVDQFDNRELQTILSHVEDKPIIYQGKFRLLTRLEILDYGRQLRLDIANIVPLLVVNDRDWFTYRLDHRAFCHLDPVRKTFSRETDNAREFINLFR